MTSIKWRLDHPDAQTRSFRLDETKTWKGKLIHGHDIAEMIAEELWETEALTVRKLHILAPEAHKGAYEVTPVFEPVFTAKRCEVEPAATKVSDGKR